MDLGTDGRTSTHAAQARVHERDIVAHRIAARFVLTCARRSRYNARVLPHTIRRPYERTA